MDNTNNSNNNKNNNNRPFKTSWWIWIYLIIFYIYSSIVYGINQRAYEDEQKAKEEAQEIIEFESIEYELSLKEIEDNQEVWKTYDVNVIDGKEYSGTYWLDNSKTEGYIIKVVFEDDGSVKIEEWTQDKIRVRHLAKLEAGSIHIKEYDKIVIDKGETENNGSTFTK